MADTSMQGQKDTEKISVQKTFDIELSKHVMNKGLEHDKSYEIQGLDHGDCIDDPNIVDEGKNNKDGASIMFIQKLNSSLRIRVKEFLLINWFKLLVIILMVTGSSIVKYGEYVQKIDVEKPYDIMHQLLLPLNLFAMENPGFRDVWIATTSFLLDLQFFFVMINWFKDGYSMRTPISVLMFYGIRAVIQQLYILPFPEHMYWEDPGFP
eukprot:CAMPEP_0196997908 /NCGR_PEP_ID=MMETSP1380-20130617/3412_1 /TAXON_ID=5936 /ORGANISM="Euplotes crassus, Strain CT5" /LENGTH=208 /DNA_ID=CAMNT_0042414291 /DNA_START=17 /DNA_END=643 /DNA_ORIENTATION=+